MGKHHKHVCIIFVSKAIDLEFLIRQDVFRLGVLMSIFSELFLQ